MSKFSYGITSFLKFAIDPITGLKTGTGVEIPVHRDSFDWVEQDGAESYEYTEQQSSTPFFAYVEPGAETIEFNIPFATDPDLLVAIRGGEKVTVDTVVGWEQPLVPARISGWFEILTTDGTQFIIRNGLVVGRKNYQFRRNGVLLLGCKIIPQDTGIEDLGPVYIGQPLPAV